MRLLKPSYEILTDIDSVKMLKSIELAGRNCYKSEHKITDDSYSTFVKMILNRGHLSVIEHEKITIRFVVDRGFPMNWLDTILLHFHKNQLGTVIILVE